MVLGAAAKHAPPLDVWRCLIVALLVVAAIKVARQAAALWSIYVHMLLQKFDVVFSQETHVFIEKIAVWHGIPRSPHFDSHDIHGVGFLLFDQFLNNLDASPQVV